MTKTSMVGGDVREKMSMSRWPKIKHIVKFHCGTRINLDLPLASWVEGVDRIHDYSSRGGPTIHHSSMSWFFRVVCLSIYQRISRIVLEGVFLTDKVNAYAQM